MVTTASADPSAYLPDDSILHILEFVGMKAFEQQHRAAEDDINTNPPSISVLTVARFYSHFASLSTRWKNILDRIIAHPKLSVDVDFSSLNDAEAATLWMCRHEVCIASLVGNEKTFTRCSPLLFKLLLECKTETTLTSARVSLFSLDDNSLMQNQRDFQGLLAQQCPNLKNLHLDISNYAARAWNECMRSNEEYIGMNSILFSQSSVRTVVLNIQKASDDEHGIEVHEGGTVLLNRYPEVHTVDEMFFSRIIQGWGKLHELSLECDYFGRGARNFHIQSMSLQVLHLENWQPSNVVRFRIDCPNLTFYSVCAEDAPLSSTQTILHQNVSEDCKVEFSGALSSATQAMMDRFDPLVHSMNLQEIHEERLNFDRAMLSSPPCRGYVPAG